MTSNILPTGVSNAEFHEILLFGQVLTNRLPEFGKIIPEMYLLLSQPDTMLSSHLEI